MVMTRETIRLAPCLPAEKASSFLEALGLMQPGDLLIYHVGFTDSVPSNLKRAVGDAVNQGLCLASQRPTSTASGGLERTFQFSATKARPKPSTNRR